MIQNMEKKSTSPNDAEKMKEEDKYKDIKIEELQLGIWKLKLAPEPMMNLGKRWDAIKSGFPLFVRLVTDIYNIAPTLFILLILCQFWDAIQETLLLQQSNNLLKTFEDSLISGKPNIREILKVVVTRALWTIVISWVTSYQVIIADALEYKVSRHYELALMRSSLDIDLSTAQSHGSKQEVSAHQAWYSLQDIIALHTTTLQMASKLFLIMQLSRTTGGPLVALLCAIQPICALLFTSNTWAAACLGFVTNPHYTRLDALRKLNSHKFKPDIISGGLARWIGDEFKKSDEALGSTSGKHPIQLLGMHIQSKSDIIIQYLGDLPTLFFAINALMHPSRHTISSVAALHQTSTSLRTSIQNTLNLINTAHKSFLKIKLLYDTLITVNSLKTGDTPYPHTPEKPSKMVDPSKGMSFQLKNITFSYAGSQKPAPALNDISLDIKPGDLVIIVGANGSGKSTLIRLLSRLYDPTSGTILIDDLPSSQYKIEDLQQATSLLSQESQIYPLSLAENIGLGYPERVGDMDMVREAASQGGAMTFMEKLEDGIETTLEPSVEVYHRNLYGKVTHPLYLEMKKLRQDIDISGGEKQRIVAARSFMRFKSGKVKFVAVDEPSSALDAEGELQLFKNLLAVREGKTMVFVTHRFGHLTKYANLIVCMKDGSIVESGTHAELMAKEGEYANLYKIQASAFSDVSP